MIDRRQFLQSVSALFGVMACLRQSPAWGAGLFRPDTLSLGSELLLKAGSAANAAVSPYSIFAALALLSRAADGRTLRNIQASARTIGDTVDPGAPLPVATDIEAVAAQFLEMTGEVGADNVLKTANALWLAEDVKLHPDFRVEPLNAERRPLPKAAADILREVNKWVDGVTEGRIPMVLEQVADDTRLVLANAFFFKGLWAQAFVRSKTRPAAFRMVDGSTKRVPMMRAQFNSVLHHRDERFEAIRLPFRGGMLDYFIVTTTTPSDPAGILATAESTGAIGRWLESRELTLRSGSVSIPRHSVDTSLDLAAALQSLGLTEPFATCADLSRLTEERLQVDQVAHRAKFEVNEEGAEAAAATAVTMGRSAIALPEPGLDFALDRPFIGFLVHRAAPSLPLMQCLIRNPAVTA